MELPQEPEAEMSSRISRFWEETVPKGWKHLPDHMPVDKRRRLCREFCENVFPYVPINEKTRVLDWGCGGGLMTKEIARKFGCKNLDLVDISAESLSIAEKYTGVPCNTHIVPDNIASMKITTGVDLLVCYSTLQHFPDKEYWEAVSEYWLTLRPEYIVIRTKTAKTTTAAASYYSGQQFLNGLLLSPEDLKKPFLVHYEVLHEKKGLTRTGREEMFLVLRRQTGMRIALAFYAFNRPGYLKKTISALEANPGKKGIDFYYFQDGAVNQISGRRCCADEKIQQCLEIVKKSSIRFSIKQSEKNKGIAIQQMESTRCLFKELRYDTIIGLGDDVTPARSFLHVRRVLIDQFIYDPSVFSALCCYVNHMTREQKAPALDKYIKCYNMTPPGGWTIFRHKWLQLLPEYMPYYELIEKQDYVYRNHAQIRKLTGHSITSHDGAYEWALGKTNMHNVWPVVNRCRDIGARGTHKRPHIHGRALEKTHLDEFEEDFAITKFHHAPKYARATGRRGAH